jgi:hypothetical protein
LILQPHKTKKIFKKTPTLDASAVFVFPISLFFASKTVYFDSKQALFDNIFKKFRQGMGTQNTNCTHF